MVTESTIPKFTSPAARIWNSIPANAQQKLVSMAWCSTCQQETTVVGYSGAIKAGHVLLRGTCAKCSAPAYRFIEVKWNEDESASIVFGKSKLTYSDAVITGELAQKEMRAMQKRQRQLDKREDEGTITKAEQSELKNISKIQVNELIMKLHTAAFQLRDSIDC